MPISGYLFGYKLFETGLPFILGIFAPVIYRRGINIALLILSFLAAHLHGVAAPKSNAHAIGQKQSPKKTASITVKKEITKVLASGEGNSSEFLFQRIQHQQQPQPQARTHDPSFFLCLLPSAIGLSAEDNNISGLVAPIPGFLPVVYKLLYPKHWFW